MTLNAVFRTRLVALSAAGLALVAPVTAGAQTFGLGLGLELFCGLGHPEPVPIKLDDSDPVRLASVNATTTILGDDDGDGTVRIKQKAVLRMINLQGNVEWKAGPFVITSQEFAAPFNGPGFDVVTPASLVDTSSHLALYPPIASECVSVGAGEHNGNDFVLMAVGTLASAGTAESPEDLSLVVVYVFNASNGSLVQRHKVGPRAGWFMAGYGGPAVLDMDGDGNSELVVQRVRGLSNNRAEFMFERFNLVNGTLEGRTRLIQKNNQFNQNPEGFIPDLPFGENAADGAVESME